MHFEDRQVQYPGKKRLIKVDADNNNLGEPEILVNIVRDEGDVETEGTAISADNLNAAFAEKVDLQGWSPNRTIITDGNGEIVQGNAEFTDIQSLPDITNLLTIFSAASIYHQIINLGNGLKICYGRMDGGGVYNHNAGFSKIFFANSSLQVTGDTQTQRSGITLINSNQIQFKGNTGQSVTWWILGV